MTPVGECPGCDAGHLTPCPESPGWTRCPACSNWYDHHGNAYNTNWGEPER